MLCEFVIENDIWRYQNKRKNSFIQTCMTHTIAECTVNKLLMMDRGTVRNM